MSTSVSFELDTRYFDLALKFAKATAWLWYPFRSKVMPWLERRALRSIRFRVDGGKWEALR